MKKNIKFDFDIEHVVDSEANLAQVFGYAPHEFGAILRRMKALMEEKEYYVSIFNELLEQKESGKISDKEFFLSMYMMGILQGRSTQIMAEKMTEVVSEIEKDDEFDHFIDNSELGDYMMD